MTGYERSPDYGGRPVTWATWAGLALVVAAIVGWLLWSAPY